MVIGKGPEREALEQLARTLGVADRVEFLGPLPHERALEEMARCHVHVMPSSHEPFGVAHIEAMAAGLVAIGGAGTGARGHRRRGGGDRARAAGRRHGARPGDRPAGRAMTASGSGSRQAARATVAAHFTWERNGERTAALYRELAKLHGKEQRMGHDAFRAGVEAQDLGAMVDALSPDVVFHSPITFKPFEGKEAVSTLLGVVAATFEDFRYTDELDGDGVKALVFEARVGDKQVQGLDLLRFDDDGLIEDFTVMVRPLSAAMALAEAVGKGLERAAAPS